MSIQQIMKETIFFKEIMETAESLRNTLTYIGDRADNVAKNVLTEGAHRIVALGSGGSYFASAASVYLHNDLVSSSGTLAWAVPTGEYALYPNPLATSDVLVGVSVSGELNDLLDLFDQVQHRHQLVGVTNVDNSTLARLVDQLLLMKAGPSRVLTSTKTFVASVAALDLFWLGVLKAQNVSRAEVLYRELLSLPAIVEESLRQASDQIDLAASRLENCERIFVFGSGPAFPLAQEVALVFKEVANLPSEGLQTREMAQGNTAVVDKRVGVIAIAPPGPGQETARKVLAQCQGLGAVGLEVGVPGAQIGLKISCDPLLSPLVYGNPLFMLAGELACRRGADPDHPKYERDYVQATRRDMTTQANT